MNLPPPGQRTTLFGGAAVAAVALLVVVAFLPIARCPNCRGSGAATSSMNSDWRRAHPFMLLKPTYESLGLQGCVRCESRGRVSPIGALTQ